MFWDAVSLLGDLTVLPRDSVLRKSGRSGRALR